MEDKLLFTLGRDGERLVKTNIGVDEREVGRPGGGGIENLRLASKIVSGKRKDLSSESDGRGGEIGDIENLGDGFTWFDGDLNDGRREGKMKVLGLNGYR